MDFNPVIIAIPIFFLAMGLELLYEALTRKHTYRLNDALSNIGTGTLNQVSGTFLKVLGVGVYTIFYEYAAIWEIPRSVWSFAAAFIVYDLCYYWSHRMAHEVSLFWGGHVVHHQSEDFNLSVALRQSSTSIFWSFFFYIPMALVGFHPIDMALAGGFNLLYQFWIHTEHIGKLGWFELVFNTPSHHRVHHGRDPKYIDKNYAGAFIIWDRMFGTFKEEEERPTYGITKPLNSWNPVYANFAHYIDLFDAVKKTPSWGDKLRILMNKPGWLPEEQGGYQAPTKPEPDYRKFNVHRTRNLHMYVVLQFLVAMATTSYYLFTFSQFDVTTKVLYSVWIMVSTMMLGLLLEVPKKWINTLEISRLIITLPAGIAMYAAGYLPLWTVPITATVVGISLVWFWRIRGSEVREALG